MCADNGVVAEGVSQTGQEVTAVVAGFMGQQASSVGKNGAPRRCGCDPGRYWNQHKKKRCRGCETAK